MEFARTLERLAVLLKADDILIDGGNSNFRDTIARASEVQKTGVHFVDVGTSALTFQPANIGHPPMDRALRIFR